MASGRHGRQGLAQRLHVETSMPAAEPLLAASTCYTCWRELLGLVTPAATHNATDMPVSAASCPVHAADSSMTSIHCLCTTGYMKSASIQNDVWKFLCQYAEISQLPPLTPGTCSHQSLGSKNPQVGNPSNTTETT